MTKRVFLLAASVVFLACTLTNAQEPTPAPQATSRPVTSVTPQPTPSASATTPFAPNVRVEVMINDQTPNGAAFKKSVSVTTNRSGSVRAGVNVPIPTVSLPPGSPTGASTTSYNYRTMGLNLDVLDVEVRENQIRVRLNLEYSPLDENEKPATATATPMSYSNFSQTFYLVLENGKPMVAAVTSDPVPNHTRTLSVEVKATILK